MQPVRQTGCAIVSGWLNASGRPIARLCATRDVSSANLLPISLCVESGFVPVFRFGPKKSGKAFNYFAARKCGSRK